MYNKFKDRSFFFSEISKEIWAQFTNTFKSYCTFNFHKIYM